MKTPTSVVLTLSTIIAWPSYGEEFGGIDFPDGVISFADEVVSYDPAFSGGVTPTEPTSTNPQSAIGVPDHPGGDSPGSVALGSGGRIVLRFTNNELTGSDDNTPDLHIFEVGAQVEDTFVDISSDGVTWHSLGKVFGATSSIDLDSFGFTSVDKFFFVRLTDDPNEGGANGPTVGADIDAVGAISTLPAPHTPQLHIETAILLSFESALGSFYTIEESLDLSTWTDTIVDIEGDGTVKKYFFEVTTPRKTYRLKPPQE